MTITHKLKMDFVHHGVTPRIDVVQGDINSRKIEMALFSGGVSWEIPADVTVSMRYGKPDGTKGIYDALPDGSTAWSIDENVISMTLAPQMLTVAGSVLAQIVMIRGIDLLATFALQINVAKDPSAGSLTSEDYINWLQAYMKDEIQNVFQSAKDAGELTGPQGEPGSLIKTLLWENASVTSEFTSQPILIDSFTDYDGFEIVYYDCISTLVLYCSGYMPRVMNTPYKLIADYFGSGSGIRHRNVEFVQITAGDGFLFGAGYYHNDSDAGDGTESNVGIIPYIIYGIKGVN